MSPFALNSLPSPSSLSLVHQVPPTQQDVTADSHPSQQLLASLTQSTPQQQKQIIGEHLYREIYSMHADLAGKITGKDMSALDFHNPLSIGVLIREVHRLLLGQRGIPVNY